MDRKRFRVAVAIETGKLGQFKTLANVADAAVFLMDEWPAKETPERLAAMAACYSALGGDTTAEDARIALIRAAKASDIFTREDDRPAPGSKKPR